ncbi:MAG: TFIIB-type zinc ribbon-containing protein [Actinomycetota bacterium]|nr:TFIIB-type zinc ribbon-containing protein [Actinomycetota bacterium]
MTDTDPNRGPLPVPEPVSPEEVVVDRASEPTTTPLGSVLPGLEEPTGPETIRTDADAKDGLAKCARCGSTDIALNPASGKLRCGFCRHEWDNVNMNEAFGLDKGIGALSGTVMGSGSVDIVPSTDVVLTFKCTACGAEVVIDTDHGTQARCHWCRNVLSMNQQIPNGAVPDMVLPFRLPKDEAVKRIAEFVGKRKFYAHPRFRAEFNPENVMGLYLPYMVVDVNAHARFDGHGEHETRSYTVKVGDNTERRYDADLYKVAREFDLHVNDLTVESSSERLSRTSAATNNIINSIMPFDTASSVRYDSNYLAGFTMERRDTNLEHLAPLVQMQAADIARYQANATLEYYGRGVRWDAERLDVVGQRWVSAYLPVWLYGYYERRRDGSSFLHYVAVNGRTGETMGSVPINQRRLVAASAVSQVVGTVLAVIILLVGG